jgi:hypothetical protein
MQTTNDLGIVAAVLLAFAVGGTTVGAVASIQHLRLQARRTQCTSGLKTIGIALHNAPQTTVSNVAGTE